MHTVAAAPNSPALRGRHLTQRRFGDPAFKWFTLLMALSVFVLIVLIGEKLAQGAQLSMRKFGWHFLVSSE